MSQANQVEIRNEDRDSWNAWADERINSALEQHQNFVSEVTGEALGEISAGLREEFRKELEAVTGKLGVELRELIAGLRIEFARLEMELAGRFTSLEKELLACIYAARTARIRITTAWTSSRLMAPATSLDRTVPRQTGGHNRQLAHPTSQLLNFSDHV